MGTFFNSSQRPSQMRDDFDLNEPNMTTILEDRELGCPPVAVIAATGIESTEESISQNRVENSQNNTNQAEGKKNCFQLPRRRVVFVETIGR